MSEEMKELNLGDLENVAGGTLSQKSQDGFGPFFGDAFPSLEEANKVAIAQGLPAFSSLEDAMSWARKNADSRKNSD